MKQLSGKRFKKIFILKIDLPALLAFALFAGLIFFYLIPTFEKVMMDRKRDLISEITSSAYSLLEYYHSREISGDLEREESQKRASATISTIRYGDERKDYLWITDMYPRMIAHPYRPDLNGQDLTNFQDSKGKTIFVEFVEAVSLSGESYVEYMWQWNDDSTRIVPKLSYVKKFEPWNWIIGTGIYIEDVKSEIRKMETRALMISGIIGLIIVILLTAISRQSHKIEKKRSQTEEELHKSRELYRTLAEAASEGVMIWSDNRIQANKTVLTWLGYREEELLDLKFGDILKSSDPADFNDSDTVYEELSARRNLECVLKKKSGQLIKSHASLSRIRLEGIKAVLVVIRPSDSIVSQPGFSPQPPLLNNISAGFFRITYGRKNIFLYASNPALKILGYNNLQDLIPHTVESFFVIPGQFKAFRAALESKENITDKEVLLQHKDGSKFWARVSAMVIESETGDIWCEGTIEYLAASAFHKNILVTDLNEYSASFIMQAPVSSISIPATECRENMSIKHAISLMKEKKTDLLVITNKDGGPMGVIDSGIIGFRLAAGGSSDTEIFKWMNSPPGFVSHDAKISEAFGMIQETFCNCLIVKSEENNITRIITNDILTGVFSMSPQMILSEIENSVTSQNLGNIFLNSRKIAVPMLLAHADPFSVSSFISTIADAVCQRVLTLCLEEMREPPCRFAFIQTGSAGRREQTFSTDQDNAIIFENVPDGSLAEVTKYFLELGQKVNERLADAGFRLCKGENMAGNPKWCQPLEMWKKYFSGWIKMPGPDELLKISIFFDFRFCFGDKSLSDELREYIRNDLKTNDIFFHHMTSAWKQFNPSANILAGGKTDIKRILMPLTGIIRLYALKYGIEGLSTPERIVELHSGGHIDNNLLSESMRAWKDLTSIRLNHQAACINKGIEPDNIVDFQIVNTDLYYFAERAIITVNNLILKAGSDFYTNTI